MSANKQYIIRPKSTKSNTNIKYNIQPKSESKYNIQPKAQSLNIKNQHKHTKFESILGDCKLLDYAQCLETPECTGPEMLNITLSLNFKGNILKSQRKIREEYNKQEYVRQQLMKQQPQNNFNVDPMTKLPFKAEMSAQLLSICNQNQSAALICADIDNMKELNDKGHHVADVVIKTVGNIFKDYSKNKGINAFRLYQGGDEFGLIINDHTKDDVYDIANSLRQLVNDSTSTSISMGIAIRNDTKKEIRDVWFQHAEDALKKAKDNGKNKIQFYKNDVKIKLNQFSVQAAAQV
eukprot:81885_1